MKYLIFHCEQDHNRYVVNKKSSNFVTEDGELQFYLWGNGSKVPMLEGDPIENIEENKQMTIRTWIPSTLVEVMLTGYFEYINDEDLDVQEYQSLMNTWSTNIFDDTMAFQQKYGLWRKDQFGILSEEEMKVKIGHLYEELAEIDKAHKEGNIYEISDGLIDLIYVASGLLNLMNMPAQALWNDVQARNMQKIRATKDNVGKRGSTFDVIKPEGWLPPRTKDIVDSTRH
mgnify:FL=1